MVDKPEKKGSKGSEDVEQNPQATASAEVREEHKKSSVAKDGKQPLRLEELLDLAKSDPNARDLLDGLSKLNKEHDEKTRKELIRWLGNSASMHFGRELADLKDGLQNMPGKHERSVEALLKQGRGLIRFTGEVPAVITHELKAIKEAEMRDGKPQGFAEHALAMIKNLKESLIPADAKKSAEKSLRQSIAEQLAPQLDELRTKKAGGVEKLSEEFTVETKAPANPEVRSEAQAEKPAPENFLVGNVKSFDHETITNVQLLEKALHSPGPFGLPFGEHVDFKKLKDVLDGLPVEKRQQVAEAYMTESKSTHTFFEDLRWLGGDHPADVQEIEAMFERRKGVTDWAGDLQNDLIRLRELKQRDEVLSNVVESVPGMRGVPQMAESLGLRDPQIANVERAIRHTVAMMPSIAIGELKEQHQEIFNQLTTDPVVGKDTRDALKIMFDDPGWGNSPGAVTKMVRIALDNNNFDLFKDAMRFSTQESRNAFAKTPEAQQIKTRYSLGAEVVSDLIANGNESLITGLHQNTKGFGWLGANKEEVARLVEFASANDRAAFTRGESFSKLKNPTEEQQSLIYFFRSVDKALKEATLYNKTEYDLLKHKMTGTPEIYADLRNLHNDGIFGNWQKNDFNGMKKVVENISEENWKSLRENPDHLARLNEDLKEFLNDKERDDIMRMLKEKVGDEKKDKLTYEQSKEKGKRSVEDFFAEEVPAESWNQLSQTKCRLAKLDRILQLTPAEKELYRKDQKHLDKLISADLQADELLVARRKLKQVLTGDEKPDPVSEAILANLHNANSATRARKLEAALATMDLKRLTNPKDEEDKEARKAFEEMIKHFCDDAGLGPRYDGDGQMTNPGSYDEFIKKTFETGTVSMDLKSSFIKHHGLSIEDLTRISSPDAQLLLAKNDFNAQFVQNAVFKSKEQAELAREILHLKSPKDVTEVMRIRAVAVGFDEPAGRVIDKLAAMKPKDRAKLEQEYLKYNSTISADLLQTATGADRRRIAEMYSPVPLGQKIISHQRDLSKQDGAADGFLMDGAVDAHSKVAKVYAQNKEIMSKLDPQTRAKLDTALENYFAAKANFVKTKRETAEAAAEATTMLMAVALSIADPPASAAILTSAGVVGAGVKLQIARALMGSDFNESQSLKIAGSGFLDISFGFADKVIPVGKLIRLDSKIAAEASEVVCNKLARESTASFLKEDAKELLKAGMSQMSHTHCAFGSKEFEHEVHKLAKSSLKEGADAKDVERLVALIQTETRERISASVRQKLKNEIYKAGESSTVETGSNLTKEAILDPDKMKLDELGVRSTSEVVASLLKCIEMRVAGHALGKITDHANLQLAKRELFEAAKNSLPKQNYLRVIENTKALEKRIDNPKESAKTLREISQFFKPRLKGPEIDHASVPDATYLLHLGEMTLFDCAHPHQIDQGFNLTCNTAVVQKQLAFNAPHRYSQMMYDIAGRNKFVTADGTTTIPSEIGAFTHDLETGKYLGKRDSWTDFEDLKREHFRSPTGKLMQTVVANAHWSRVERDLYLLEKTDGSYVADKMTEGAVLKKFAPGEIVFLGTENQHQLCFKKGDTWEPFRRVIPKEELEEAAALGLGVESIDPYYTSPHLGSEHIEDMYNQIAGPGHFDNGLVLIGAPAPGADPDVLAEMSKHQTLINSEEQLKSILVSRSRSGKGATAIAVDSARLTGQGKPQGHVVLGLYNQAAENCDIFNSNGRRSDAKLDFKSLFDCLLEETLNGTAG